MADPFDSLALFAEFNRPRQASDTILMSNLSGKGQKKGFGKRQRRLSGEGEREIDQGANSSPSVMSSESEDSSDSEEESENETTASATKPEQGDEDGPVEIGRDEAGCIMYRPGKRERELGKRLLQSADYDHQDIGDQNENGNEVETLRRRNTMYRKQTRLIDPTRHIPAGKHSEAPALQVLFMNHDFARKHRADIERFVSDLILSDMEERPMRPVRTRPHHVCLAEGSGETRDEDESFHQQRTSTVIGCSRFYTEYVVDNMGFPLVDYIPALSDGWEIPRYQQQYQKVLPAENDSEDDDKPSPPKRQGSACFNCGGNHRLNECQDQRDFQRIAENRRKFQNNKENSVPLGTLNQGIVDSSRFSAFKPGQYSKALLDALGVPEKRLPFFVYKMRTLGYPPGYLKAAEIQTSGIAMFGEDGEETNEGKLKRDESEPSEDGEADGATRVLYNTDKLVEFPGFNSPLPDGFPDEAHILGFPPMQPDHSKEYMEKNLPTPRGVKRQHSRTQDNGDGRKRRRTMEDMDLDESETEMSNADSLYEESTDEVASPYVWVQHRQTAFSHQQYPCILTPPGLSFTEQFSSPGLCIGSIPPPPPPLPPPPPPPESPPCSPSPPPPPQSPPPCDIASHPVRQIPLNKTAAAVRNGTPPSSPTNLPLKLQSAPSSPSHRDIPPIPSDRGREVDVGPKSDTMRLIPLDRMLPSAATGVERSSIGSPSRSDTPTLEDLQAQQNLLRQQLEGDDDSQSSVGTPGGDTSNRSSPLSTVNNSESHEFTVPKLPSTPVPMTNCPPSDTPSNLTSPLGTSRVTPPESTLLSGGSTSTLVGDPFSTPRNVDTSLNRSGSASIERKLSTPVRRKNTEDLPDASLFAVGVEDHIPFENLPNATGTYDKMKDVIAQIRRLKKSQ